MKIKKRLTDVKQSFVSDLDQAIVLASSFEPYDSVDELSNFLYTHWYTKSSIKKVNKPLPQQEWEEVFRAVYNGTYCWEKGWKVLKVSSAGRVVASREKEERMLYSGDYISLLKPGLLPVPGTEIEVVSRRDSTEDQPGFWIAYSSTWFQISESIIRIYWNINPEGAIHLTKLISEKLSDYIPHSFKLPIEEIGYQRVDTAVLYIEANDFMKLKPMIKLIYTAMIPFLHSEVPGFTKMLEPGVGLAEDPMDKSESFGLNRCRLIAEGYQLARKNYSNDLSAIKPIIKNYLERQGISLTSPYLNNRGKDEYEW